jgi:hypothetical protein
MSRINYNFLITLRERTNPGKLSEKKPGKTWGNSTVLVLLSLPYGSSDAALSSKGQQDLEQQAPRGQHGLRDERESELYLH